MQQRHATIDPHGLDTTDPNAKLPDIEREFPGVTRWFELRRRATKMREEAARKKMHSLKWPAAIDIPISGADWPYGRPLDADKLEKAARETGMPQSEWRVRSMHEPPGTIVRVRIDPEGRARQFIDRICDDATQAERRHREKQPGASLAALCAHFAGRDMRTRWMGSMSAAGLVRTAPPDAIAIAMAAYAATFVMDLPGHEADGALGERRLDILLPHAYTTATVEGRARLDAIEEAIIGLDPQLALLAPTAAPTPAGEHWRIAGLGASAAPESLRPDVINLQTRLEPTLPTAPPLQTDTRKSDEHFMARIGHAVTLSLARAPLDATMEELALDLATEHGLSAGHDRRIRRYAACIGAHDDDAGNDLRLALDRLAAIEEDPCRAAPITRAIDAARERRRAATVTAPAAARYPSVP